MYPENDSEVFVIIFYLFYIHVFNEITYIFTIIYYFEIKYELMYKTFKQKCYILNIHRNFNYTWSTIKFVLGRTSIFKRELESSLISRLNNNELHRIIAMFVQN